MAGLGSEELRQSRLVQKGMEEQRTRTRQLEERLRAGQQEQDEAKKRWQAVARQLQEAETPSIYPYISLYIMHI